MMRSNMFKKVFNVGSIMQNNFKKNGKKAVIILFKMEK